MARQGTPRAPPRLTTLRARWRDADGLPYARLIRPNFRRRPRRPPRRPVAGSGRRGRRRRPGVVAPGRDSASGRCPGAWASGWRPRRAGRYIDHQGRKDAWHGTTTGRAAAAATTAVGARAATAAGRIERAATVVAAEARAAGRVAAA